jgi:hypothetical protein
VLVPSRELALQVLAEAINLQVGHTFLYFIYFWIFFISHCPFKRMEHALEEAVGI